MTVSAVRERLRRATRASHDRLEAVVDVARTPAGYRRLLAAMLGFHGPLDEALARLAATCGDEPAALATFAAPERWLCARGFGGPG